MKKTTLFTLLGLASLAQAATISNFDFDTAYTTANDADQGNTASFTLRLDDVAWGTNGGTGTAFSGDNWRIDSIDFIHEITSTNTFGLSISDGLQTISSDNTINQTGLSFGDIMTLNFTGDTETFDSSDTLTFTFTGALARIALSGGQDSGAAINSLSSGSVNFSATSDAAIRINATQVPEPSSALFLCLGGLAALAKRRRK